MQCYAKYTATLFGIEEFDIQMTVHRDIFV